jgi:hypothetical protein
MELLLGCEMRRRRQKGPTRVEYRGSRGTVSQAGGGSGSGGEGAGSQASKARDRRAQWRIGVAGGVGGGETV